MSDTHTHTHTFPYMCVCARAYIHVGGLHTSRFQDSGIQPHKVKMSMDPVEPGTSYPAPCNFTYACSEQTCQ